MIPINGVKMVEFVSYDGSYPNLCAGTLKLRIDGENVIFPDYCLTSGGCVTFDDDWQECVTEGRWYVDVPEEFAAHRDEIEEIVNENVPWGCCGGCV